MPYRHAPKSVIKRLPIYLRILDNLIRRDIEIISSKELSEETGFTAEQIRKDLAFFGAFGTRGTGYNATYLRDKILKIIGLHKRTSVIVVGAGHLGRALTRYNMTKNPYVNIVGVFDNDTAVVGEKLYTSTIKDVKDMAKFIAENNVKVAILAVPAEYAQGVVEQMVEGGIKAILNFAPTKLDVPKGVHVHNADLTIELQSLIYYTSTAEDEEL